MELKKLKCPTCGSVIDGDKIDFNKRIAKCPACDETFIVEQAKNFALVEVDKTKDVANYRRNLAVATEKDDAAGIKRYAEKLLDILPEDYEAGYFYAYAAQRLGDSRYLYDFYNDFEKEYTEEACMRVAEHIISHGELRDNGLIERFLKNLDYSSDSYLSYYRQVFSEKLSKEELYDDITRDVFICHRSINGDVAERIVKVLESDGNKCWISSRNLRPNDNENYWNNIKRAIKSCRIFLVVSSRDAMLSTDVKKEMAFAKDLNKPRLEVKIDESEHTSVFKDFFDGCKWIKGENHEEIKARVSDLLLKVLSGTGSGVIVHKVKKADFTPIQEAKEIKKVVVDDLHEHNFQKIEVVPPTCNENGFTLYRCECGEEKKTDFTPKRTEHDFKVAERKEPTCTENGYIKYECVYCDATKKEELAATGHNYKLSDKKEPTCKDEGHEIYKCSVCGDTKVKALPKTAHTYGRWIVTKIAECESQGEESRQCSFCGETETRPTSAKGHTYGKWVTEKEPTCTEKGKKMRQCQCSDCRKKDYMDIAPTGHSFSEWQDLPDGKTQERVCQKCGETETRTTEEYRREQKRIQEEYRKEQERIREERKKEEERKRIIEEKRKTVKTKRVYKLLLIALNISFVASSIIGCVNTDKLSGHFFEYRPLLLFIPFSITALFSIPTFIIRIKKRTIFEQALTLPLFYICFIFAVALPFSIIGLVNIGNNKGYYKGCYYKVEDGTIVYVCMDNSKNHLYIPVKFKDNYINYIIINGEYAFDKYLSHYSYNDIYYEGDLKDWCGTSFIRYGQHDLYVKENGKYVCIEGDFEIPDGVMSIGYYAFSGCSSLTSVTIPDNVVSIGDSAFSFCSSLTTVTIGNGVTYIGSWAFSCCSSLTSISFNGTKAEWQAIIKALDWKYNVPATVVKCSDGDLTI